MMVNIVLGETTDAAGVQVQAYGFEDEKSGVFITDPYKSECGRFSVDPITHYNMGYAEVDKLVQLNRELAE